MLDEEQRAVQEAAHRFAEEVLRPAGIVLDRLPAREVVGPESPLRDVMRQASELGYTRLVIPTELGGLGLSPLMSYLVQEELAWGSVGLSAVLFLSAMTAGAAFASGNPTLIEGFARPLPEGGRRLRRRLLGNHGARPRLGRAGSDAAGAAGEGSGPAHRAGGGR